jgi:hypothetical protein
MPAFLGNLIRKLLVIQVGHRGNRSLLEAQRRKFHHHLNGTAQGGLWVELTHLRNQFLTIAREMAATGDKERFHEQRQRQM